MDLMQYRDMHFKCPQVEVGKVERTESTIISLPTYVRKLLIPIILFSIPFIRVEINLLKVWWFQEANLEKWKAYYPLDNTRHSLRFNINGDDVGFREIDLQSCRGWKCSKYVLMVGELALLSKYNEQSIIRSVISILYNRLISPKSIPQRMK